MIPLFQIQNLEEADHGLRLCLKTWKERAHGRDTKGCSFAIIPSKSRKTLILSLYYECPLWRQPPAHCIKPLLPVASSPSIQQTSFFSENQKTLAGVYMCLLYLKNDYLRTNVRDAIRKAWFKYIMPSRSPKSGQPFPPSTFGPLDLPVYNISTVSDVFSLLEQRVLLHKN